MPHKNEVNRNFGCFVLNCSSSTFLLKRWENKQCHLHNVSFGNENCACEAPYFFYRFPQTKKEKLEWVRIINRAKVSPNPNERTLMYPNCRVGVCSKHFVEGINVPCEKLGYEFKEHLFDHEMLLPNIENLRKECYDLEQEQSHGEAKRCLSKPVKRHRSSTPGHVAKRSRKGESSDSSTQLQDSTTGDSAKSIDSSTQLQDSTTGAPIASLSVSEVTASPEQTARHGAVNDSSDEGVISQVSAAIESSDEMCSIPETPPSKARNLPRTVDGLIREVERLRKKNEFLTGKLVRLRERHKKKNEFLTGKLVRLRERYKKKKPKP